MQAFKKQIICFIHTNINLKTHNNCLSKTGVTEAEYQFSTTNTSVVIKIGSIQTPNSVMSQSTVTQSLFNNMTVMLPIVISIIVLIAVLSTLIVFMRKQQNISMHNSLDERRNSMPKSNQLSSEIFPLNDFVSSSSKPKLFDSSSTSGNDSYGKTTSYSSTPNRKSIHFRNFNNVHEYAEPNAQFSAQQRCLFNDDNNYFSNLI
jgi:hypothetical protein